MENNEKRHEIEVMREKLANVSGSLYWRGLDELAETAEFQSWVDDEFPQRLSLPDVDRRSFLKLMGASLAMAGLAGCRNLPQEKIIPYVKAPEERYPGQILQYATAMTFGGYGMGLLITSNEGRPSKAEGNPDHPSSLGSTDIFSQAELLQMYDPDRSGIPMQGQFPSTWEEFLQVGRDILAGHKADAGAGLRILTETVTSPTLYAQIQDLLKEFPQARWHQFNPVNRDNERGGSMQAFGEIVDPQYDFSKAHVVLSVDAECFGGFLPGTVRYTRDFMANRDPDGPSMNRLYVIESSYTFTGAFADHRIPLKPSDIEGVVRAIAASLGAEGGPGKLPSGISQQWIEGLKNDLLANKGQSLVVVGERQPPAVHAIVHGINYVLGNVGKTVSYTAPVEPNPVSQYADLTALVNDISLHKVETLLILGGNPVFYAPPNIKLGSALAGNSVKNKIRLGTYEDETSAVCDWHLPESHFLEAWGDVRAIDGTVSIVQPLIAPLFDTRSAIEVISGLLGKPHSGYDLVREIWVPKFQEQGWRDLLNKGTVPDTVLPAKAVTLTPNYAARGKGPRPGAIEASFAPDPTIFDGRYCNNGWLQELPKPLTKLSWDNAVILSPATAVQLGVYYQDVVEVSANGVSVEGPIFVLPGHPDNTVTLHLGYGRKMAGKVGNDTGTDFGALRFANNINSISTLQGWAPSLWSCPVEVIRTGKTFDLATSQTHHSMNERDVVREGSFVEYAKNPSLKPENAVEDDTAILYDLTAQWSAESDVAQWGMTIDLNTCTGCNVCTIACQAENNIPTVGKDQVQKGRIMQWIRVDRYFRVEENGSERDFHEPISEVESINPSFDQGANNPAKVMSVCMPVPCMHCETAPCEVVCPVAATIHSHEGLNQMVYNRCVGTRYCSNNCPYKVRRFNFYNYQFRQKNFNQEKDIPLLNLLNNPDVTVRSRGVMEKCTYCVQRINHARIRAKEDGRDIREGEVITACQAACPSKAITFGNIADPKSAVTKLKAKRRNYSLLADLNTRPRTTYLVKVRNLNKDIPI